MTVRRWIKDKNGRSHVVLLKHVKKWESKRTKYKIKGRTFWKVIEEKVKESVKELEVYFFRFNAEYEKASDSLKIEIRYVGKPERLSDFKRICQYHITMDYNATVAGDAVIEIADLDEDDKLQDFQFLRNGRDFDYKNLKDELDKDVGS